MSTRNRLSLLLSVLVLATVGQSALAGAALAGPVYTVHTYWGDTNLPPGGTARLIVQARNVGDAVGSDELVLSNQLPPGVTATKIQWLTYTNPVDLAGPEFGLCSGTGTGLVRCSLPPSFLPDFAPPPGAEVSGAHLGPSGNLPTLYIEVAVPADASGSAANTATLTGGGSAGPVSDVRQLPFGSTPASFGPAPGSFLADAFSGENPLGGPARQAGEHPFEFRVAFDLTQKLETAFGQLQNFPRGTIKTAEVALPSGLIGNPEATPKCDPVDFADIGGTPNATRCPPETQIGYIDIALSNPVANSVDPNLEPNLLNRVALYNLEPPKGQVADFGFSAQHIAEGHIYSVLDPARNYSIRSLAPYITNLIPVAGVQATVWGVPGDPAHDKFRSYSDPAEGTLGAPFTGPIRPLLTLPMDCGVDNGAAKLRLETYSKPGELTAAVEHPEPLNVEGCDDARIRFEPDIEVAPTTRAAGQPTGLKVDLTIPQRDDVVADASDLYAAGGNVKALPTPPLKRAVVTLPEGMTVSPAAADGLAGCSPAQLGLGTDAPVTCPDSSRVGTITAHSPLLPADEPLAGGIYLATPNDNPNRNLLTLYAVLQDPDKGLLVKVPGRIDLDPRSGRITTSFDQLPQLQVSRVEVELRSGPRATLTVPDSCGTKTTTAELYSWSDPDTAVTATSSYQVTSQQDGSRCLNPGEARPFAPTFAAGLANPVAGSSSAFTLRLTRQDGEQNIAALGTTLAPGLLAKIAGIPPCPEAQAASGNCPEQSRVGSTTVATGSGPAPLYVPQPGKAPTAAYLAGPYKGAPFSLVVKVPAQAGPFDLGVVTVRNAIFIDPTDAHVTVRSDPLPQIIQGIPIRYRDIRVTVDRGQFMRAPTSCDPMQIGADVTSAGSAPTIELNDQLLGFSTSPGQTAQLTSRFQVGDCARLPFKPRLRIRLTGRKQTRDGGHPGLRARLTQRPGQAAIKQVKVALPLSLALDPDNAQALCEYEDGLNLNCPASSIIGRAEAVSPLLNEPLRGPVYFVKHVRISRRTGRRIRTLPTLLVTLTGENGVKINLRPTSDVDKKARLVSTFSGLPDAPVSSFKLTLEGGKDGILVVTNNKNLCRGKHTAQAQTDGHNGKHHDPKIRLKTPCRKPKQARCNTPKQKRSRACKRRAASTRPK